MNLSPVNNHNENKPSFGAYFSTKNAFHLKHLCHGEFNESSISKLRDKLDWFTKELPNHELEITQFNSFTGFKYSTIELNINDYYGDTEKFITNIEPCESIYTITNKNTGNSVNVSADNIFQFFSGIKEKSGILFDETKNSLFNGLNNFGTEIMTKLIKKQ